MTQKTKSVWILDFCKSCGALLGADEFTCENCNASTGLREQRIQGEFPQSEAEALLALYHK